MGEVDESKKSLISIFKGDDTSAELMRSMRDLITLAGVMRDLGSEAVFDAPLEMLRFIRIIQMINEEALGLGEPIENAETLYYRYLNIYGHDREPPTKKRIEQIINILSKNNWIAKQKRSIKMLDVGKRMMDALIRLANDSMAYYTEDEIGRSLFQARRDAEISVAYDDHGISGGNKIASMIRNVEEALFILKERELELLADRNALPQLEMIHNLMEELDVKMQERLNQFQTIEESLILRIYVQKGTSALAEGTSLSLGMINKYLRFMTMQQTPITTVISPEKVRAFIQQMYSPPMESEIPNAYQLLSFMEQGQYKDEAIDGLWIPVKMAAPIGCADIQKGIYHLETYEPKVKDLTLPDEEIEYVLDEVEGYSLEGTIGEASWVLTKATVQTDQIEKYLETKEAEIEELIIETSSSGWGDAIRGLLGIAALEGNKRIETTPKDSVSSYEKEWEWINDGDRKTTARKRT